MVISQLKKPDLSGCHNRTLITWLTQMSIVFKALLVRPIYMLSIFSKLGD